MLAKLNVRDIVVDHFSTLKNLRTGEWSKEDFFIFVGIPLVVTCGMLWAELLVTKQAVNILFTGLSIFAGLLFNLLVLAHGIIRSTVEKPRYADEKRLLKEIYSNISYTILISILMLGVLLIRFITDAVPVLYVISALTYFFVGNFLLTLLMVLKRIHVVLGLEFNREDN